MSSMDFDSLFQRFNGLKVLIVGDVMLDSYIIGKVTRMSPEAPVPVVDVASYDMRLGGAGNVALNVLALGGTPILCTSIGKDKEGDEMKLLLQKVGLTDRGLLISEKRKTTKKTRVIGNNHQIVRIDHEITDDLDTLDSFLLQQHFDRELEQADVVIMEDYNKGVLHAGNIATMIEKAKEAGIPVVVDPKKENFLAYKGATLFKPNLKEIKEGLEIESDLGNRDNLRKAVTTLSNHLENEISMVTMSEKGVYVRNESEEHFLPAHVRHIADVSGAGDTVISVAAMCLALQTPVKVLAELSNLAGGLVCEETGVVPINKAHLLAEAKKVLL
jgi:D-glycero-beta-D-manno-heptose-7-phosphate kinase